MRNPESALLRKYIGGLDKRARTSLESVPSAPPLSTAVSSCSTIEAVDSQSSAKELDVWVVGFGTLIAFGGWGGMPSLACGFRRDEVRKLPLAAQVPYKDHEANVSYGYAMMS